MNSYRDSWRKNSLATKFGRSSSKAGLDSETGSYYDALRKRGSRSS